MSSIRIISFLSLLLYVSAETRFIYPPDRDQGVRLLAKYRIGDKMPVIWYSTDGLLTLAVQIPVSGPTGSLKYTNLAIFGNGETTTPYEWEVSIGYDPTTQEILTKTGKLEMYMLLYTGGTGKPLAVSSIFEVIPADSSSSINPATTQTISSSISVATTIQATTTPTSVAIESSSSTPSASVIGGAVGGSIGGLLIFGIIGVLLWRRFRKSPPKLTPSEHDAYYGMPAVAQTNAAR